ncbi:TPM domain-containing protein [Paenibacillus athensensis]|nr:TPM domain-containing protein [Paenibacillus athensensis]
MALAIPAQAGRAAAATTTAVDKKLIVDEAGLLSKQDYDELNALANSYGAKRETDIVIYTTTNSKGTNVVELTEDFYDAQGPGYDKPHGNAVILTVDMQSRQVYLAGFYKAKLYLDDARLDRIRGKLTPSLTSGDYAQAFRTYITTAYRYMGVRPGANPDNPLFNLWVQIVAALLIAGLVVGVMVFRSGGRVTVNGKTYEEAGASKIVGERDMYVRTTITRRKIEKKSNTGGGGSGGGVSNGGHSHSGSKGSF